MNSIYLIIAPIIALSSFCTAQIYSYELALSHRGWVDDSGYGDTTNGNYIVGAHSGTEYRNYFNFDFSSVVGSVTAATLTIYVPAESYSSADLSESFALSLVDTVVDFGAASINSPEFFDDLENGNHVGSTLLSEQSNDSYIQFNLSQDFIDSANQNGSVTIGGALLSLLGVGSDPEFALAYSHSSPVTLNITVDPNGVAVPEPNSALLISLAGMSFIIRRKR